MRVLICLLVLCQPLLAMHRPTGDKPLGVKTFSYRDESRSRPVVAEFWYPTEQKAPLEKLSADSIWVHPREVRDASLHKQKYPLVLISHGHQGGRRDLSWLAETLVRQGYIVAAIDHFGDMRDRFDLFTSVRFWERARDFTFLLDQLEKEPFFQDRIDSKRIGFVGYSLGGMTGLGLAGARAQNVRETVVKLNGKFNEWPSELLDQFDFSESERSFAETRIRAFLLICPAAYPYPADALKEIRAPIGLIVTVGDEVLPFQDHAVKLIRFLVPEKLKVLKEEISHYAFQNRLSDAGKNTFYGTTRTLDRASIHREVGRFTTEFFEELLRSNP